jgi:N-formylglutamate amidohydrolase
VQGYAVLPGVPGELERLNSEHGAEILQDEQFHSIPTRFRQLPHRPARSSTLAFKTHRSSSQTTALPLDCKIAAIWL